MQKIFWFDLPNAENCHPLSVRLHFMAGKRMSKVRKKNPGERKFLHCACIKTLIYTPMGFFSCRVLSPQFWSYKKRILPHPIFGSILGRNFKKFSIVYRVTRYTIQFNRVHDCQSCYTIESCRNRVISIFWGLGAKFLAASCFRPPKTPSRWF